ncbi:hypothetical protein ACFXDP_13480 [Streptomyces sp. NPDC059374]|uniref:hypothetical protein n=1 Tax=Streptomyces sp. NPDC059374 TaxID=3346814 RepID=UPI0036B9D6DA
MSEQWNGHDSAVETRGKVVGRQRDMDFTPVRNGMDFLLSAFDHLSQRGGEPGARDLKYAVLHLQAAVEVLLKARLIREHWSLVFSDPGKAKRSEYDKGSFHSCTVLGAVDRLNNIVALQISQEQRKAISNLADTRNALTHLGHTGSVYAVEAQAALVLDFLLTFIHEELRPVLSSEGPFVETTMDRLNARLLEVKSLVKHRSQRLMQELAPLSDRTIQCPECQQWAVVVGEDAPTCRFCLFACETPQQAAVHQMELEANTGDVELCPSCDAYSVAMGVRVAKNKSAHLDMCLGCLTDYTAWRHCDMGCETFVHPEAEPPLCEACLTDIADRFH